MYVRREGMCASGHAASMPSVRDQEPEEVDDRDMIFTTNGTLTCTECKQNDENGKICLHELVRTTRQSFRET